MYVLALPHKLFKCLLLKPKTLWTLLLLVLSPNSPPYKSTLSLFPKQTNNPKPCKSKCCIINISKNKYFKNYAHQNCHTVIKLVKTSQDLSLSCKSKVSHECHMLLKWWVWKRTWTSRIGVGYLFTFTYCLGLT
jgi:hypothetical protein